MKKLLTFLKNYKKESILSPLYKMLEAILELFVPIVMAYIIDTGIANKDVSYVVKMIILLSVLGIIGLTFSLIAQFYAAKAAVGFAKELKSALFSHIQKFSYAQLDKIGASTLITRMSGDMNTVQTGVNLTLRLLLRSPFVVFGAMIMAFTIDFKSALVFVAAIPILSAVVFIIMIWGIPLYKKVQAKVDNVVRLVRENLTGIRVLRAFGKEAEEEKAFNAENEALTSIQKFAGRISSVLNPATFALINIAIVVLIYVGAIQVHQDNLTPGSVLALYNYMSQILVELIKLASLIITITKSISSANRIQAVFDIIPESKEGTLKNIDTSRKKVVEFKNVCFKYEDSSEYSLENISFCAYNGDTIGIIGGTGSGKSTLINLIPAFYEASKGEVFIFEKNIKEYDYTALRNHISVVPQHALLFSGTIRENLKWGNEKASDTDLTEALSYAQISEILKTEGLEKQISRGGKNLSGGQRQRMTIARALVRKPDILILDDSASALDFATEARLKKSIRELEYNPTVFIVSQRVSSVGHCDLIIVLDDGKCVGTGTHDELLQSCNVYREIYASQNRGESV